MESLDGDDCYLVRSNNRNEVNNTEVQNHLNTLQEGVNFGIESIKAKHSLNTNNVIDYYRNEQK